MHLKLSILTEHDQLNFETPAVPTAHNPLLKAYYFSSSPDFRAKTLCEMTAAALLRSENAEEKAEQLQKLRWKLICARFPLAREIIKSPLIQSAVMSMPWEEEKQVFYDVFTCLESTADSAFVYFFARNFRNGTSFDAEFYSKVEESQREYGTREECRAQFQEIGWMQGNYKKSGLILARIYGATKNEEALKVLLEPIHDALNGTKSDEVTYLRGAIACAWLPFILPPTSEDLLHVREFLGKNYAVGVFADQAVRGLNGLTVKDILLEEHSTLSRN